MSTLSPASAAAAGVGSGRARAATPFLRAGVAVLLLAGVGVLAASGKGFWSGLFPATGDAGDTYTVVPVPMSITLTEDGELKPVESVEVKCELEGQSTILSVVPESTHVKAGDLIVELASDAIKERVESEDIELQKIRASLDAAREELAITASENASKLKKAEIALEVAELELRRYVEGDYEKSLATVQIEIRQTLMDIQQKEDELRKNEPLLEKGFVTKLKLEEMRFALEKARMTLEKHRLEQRILREYEKPKNEKQKQSDVDQAREELDRERQRAESRLKQAQARELEQRSLLAVREPRVARMREQYAKCKVYAPVEGVVQYPQGEMNWRSNGSRIAPGEKAFEGQILVVLPNTNQMMVSTRIHEADRHRVREGLPARISVPAVPGRTFPATLSKISRFADSEHRWFNPELKEHSAELRIDAPDALLRPGDTAEIQIFIENVESALAIPVQSIHARGAKRYVFLQAGRTIEPREVTLGRTTTSMVEITHGLTGGERVLMRADDKLVAALPMPPQEVLEAPEIPAREAVPGGPRPGGAGDGGGEKRPRGERPRPAKQ